MTFLLDCSSGESALMSVSIGFGCTKEQLTNALLSIDLDKIYERDGSEISIPCEKYLYEHIKLFFGEHLPLDEVVWFHGTRTTKNNKFESGVFPLNEALGTVWDIIISEAPSETCRNNLVLMLENGIDNYLYQLRTEDHSHWGPYGILVRDVAFNTSDLSQHDYLAMPELIEDIINAYRETFGTCLYAHYNQMLVPKLVKFKCNYRLDSGCIEAALGYLYSFVRGEPISGMAVTGIDKNGQRIFPEQIMMVEQISP